MQLASGAAVPLGPIAMDVHIPFPYMSSLQSSTAALSQAAAASAKATSNMLKQWALAQQTMHQQVSSHLTMQVAPGASTTLQSSSPATGSAATATSVSANANSTSSAAAPTGATGAPAASGTSGETPSSGAAAAAADTGTLVGTGTGTSGGQVATSTALTLQQQQQQTPVALMPSGSLTHHLAQLDAAVGYVSAPGGPIPLVSYGGPGLMQLGAANLLPQVQLTTNFPQAFAQLPSSLQPVLAPALPFGNLVGGTQKPPDESKSYWAKGTGYGHGNTTSQWNAEQTAAQRRVEEATITVYLEVLVALVESNESSNTLEALQQSLERIELVARPDSAASLAAVARAQLSSHFYVLLTRVLQRSPLIGVLSSYLRNDSGAVICMLQQCNTVHVQYRHMRIMIEHLL